MFSYTLFHMLPFSWQKTMKCKMLSLWCSFLDFSIRALSSCFPKPLCKWFHLHDRRRELKDGFYTMVFLKVWLLALSWCFHSHSQICFHHHDRRLELEDPYHTLFFLSVTCMAFSLRFNTRNAKPWCLQWSMLPSLYTNLIRWMDWSHFFLFFFFFIMLVTIQYIPSFWCKVPWFITCI